MLVPCMYCGKACGTCVDGCMESCRALGPCCNSITNCIGKGCSAVDAVCCPKDKPKPIFMWYAILMAIPTIIYAVIGLTADEPPTTVPGTGVPTGFDCDKVGTWLLVGLILAVVNICFGIYIYLRFASMIKKKAAETHAGAALRQKKPIERKICGSCFDSCGVACELFCYDVGVFFYLAFYIGVIVYVAMADEKNCGDKSDALDKVKILWVVFLVGAICVLCVSLTCEVSRDEPPPPTQVVAGGGAYYPVGQQPVVQPGAQPGYPAQGQPVQQYPQQAQAQPAYPQAPVQPAVLPAGQPAYPQQGQPAQAQYPAQGGQEQKTNAQRAGELVGNAGAKFGAFLTGKK